MVQASYGTWLYLLGGALGVGVLGLIASIIEQKRRQSR
jgi:hypothetical protein